LRIAMAIGAACPAMPLTLSGQAHWRSLARQIQRWRAEREIPAAPALPAPAGDPFGASDE
jgi:hypothetical protein